MELLDGRQTSKHIKAEIAQEVSQIKENGEKTPHLAAIIVGDDPASKTYVRSKERACERVGFDSTILNLPGDTSEATLIDQIDQLNKDDEIDGFIVQLPLPDHIDEQKV